jgi:hypothetical protein
VRLRPLTEAECYARCYGGRSEETVSILRFVEIDERPPAQEQERVDDDAREAA